MTRQGVLRQLRRRGQRGRPQADPAHRPHPRGRHRGRLPRPHHGRAGADRQGGLPRAVRAAARRRHVRARTATPTPSPRPSPTRPPRSSSSRCRARPAWSRRRTDYLARAREITREHGALLWLDEIQTGIGRTGAWFAHQNPSVADPMDDPPTSSRSRRGSAGGFPIGACLAIGDAADLLQPGNHGTTFGGNPVARRGGPGRDRHDREGRPARPRHRGRASGCATGLGADDRGHRGARLAGCSSGSTSTEPTSAEVFAAALEARVHRQQPRPPSGSGSPRRWSSPPTQADSFLDAWPGILDAAYGSCGAAMTRHFLRDDDLSPARAGGRARARPEAQGQPVRRAPARRPAHGRGALRQADAAHPGVVRVGHRRARRLPDDHRRRRSRRSACASRSPTPHACSAARPRPSCGAPTSSPGSRRWRRTPASPSSTRSPTSSTPARRWPTC